MDPARFRLLESLYDEVAVMDPAERTRFINEQCADDEALRRELLAALGGNDSGLTAIVEQSAAAAVKEDVNAVGRRMGPYRIVRPLGRGGMGAVFLAVRDDDQYHKEVAIKTLAFDLDGGPAVARFLRERQILAHLEHPNIARLIDGGTTDTGTPYIVLEYVQGVHIVEWCQATRRSLEQRLQLFLRICDAVQYAHQHLIVHRDIKPGNILVTADGEPKLLDFGIAKLLDTAPLAESAPTGAAVTSALLMTPDYVSPEQVRGEPVSTATDVYSLGGVLYELLTGCRPHSLQNYDAVEIARIVCDTPVRPPSDIGGRRLRGDLDTIVLKAMHKEAARRYSSAAELAQDIRRYLDGLPVHARRDTSMYRAAKFVRRHWVGVSAAAAVIVSLAVGIAIATRAAVEARRADETAQAVNDFLRNDLLAQASAANQSGPATKPDPGLTVRAALDRAATRIGGKFGKAPAVEAAIRETVGETYLDLGVYGEARAQLQRTFDLRRQTLGPDDPQTLRALNRLGRTAYLQGAYPEAESFFKEAAERQRRVLTPSHVDTLSSMNALAIVYLVEGKYPQAEALHRETLEHRRRVLGPEHPDTLSSVHNLAIVFDREGKYAEAEALHKQVLDLRRRILGAEHPFTLGSLNNLAGVYLEEKKYADAEALYREALTVRTRVLGADHPDTLASLNSVAMIDAEKGKYEEAADLLSRGLATWRRVMGAENPDTAAWMNNLAATLGYQGKYAEAEPLFKETIALARRTQGPEHPATLESVADFAAMYLRQGNYAQADLYGAQALAGRRRTLGSDHPDTIASAINLAAIYTLERRFDDSERLARGVVEVDRKKQPDDWQRSFAESILGADLAGRKQYGEAELLLLGGYRGMVDHAVLMTAPERQYLDLAAQWIPALYLAWGKPDVASTWRDKLTNPTR